MKEEIKSAVQEEKKKLSEMTIKEKADYIWEYYKLQIIGILVVVVLGYSLIDSLWLHPAKKVFVNFAYFRAYIYDENSERFAAHLTEELVVDKEKEKVYFSNFYLSDEASHSETDIAMSQKFSAMLAAKELDIVAVDELDYVDLVNLGMFLDLEEAFGADVLAGFGDQVMTSTDEETGITTPYAIRIDGNALLESYIFPTEGYMIGIVSNSEKVENAKKVLLYVLQ